MTHEIILSFVLLFFVSGGGALVNSSRGVIYAMRPSRDFGDRLVGVLDALRCPSIHVGLDPAAMVMSGVTLKPGAVVGTRNIEMPRCFGALGSVRAANQM